LKLHIWFPGEFLYVIRRKFGNVNYCGKKMAEKNVILVFGTVCE